MAFNFVDDLGFDGAGMDIDVEYVTASGTSAHIDSITDVKFDDRGVYATETRPGPQVFLTFIPWTNVRRISQYISG